MTDPVFLFGSFTEDEATSYQFPALGPSIGTKTQPPAEAVKQNGSIHAARPVSSAVKQNGHLAPPSKGTNNSNGRVILNGKAAENAVDALGKALGQSYKKQPARPGVAVPAGGQTTAKRSVGGGSSAKSIVSPTTKPAGQLANGGMQSKINHTAILTPKAPPPAENGGFQSSVKASGDVGSNSVNHVVPARKTVEVPAENGCQADWLVINAHDASVAKNDLDSRGSLSNPGVGNSVKGSPVESAAAVVGSVGSSGSSETNVLAPSTDEESEVPPSKLVPRSWAALVGVPGEAKAAPKQPTAVKGKGRGSLGPAGSNKAQVAEVVVPTVTELSGEVWLKSLNDAEVSGRRLQPRGLINTGNSCFLNSTVQAMLSCSAFTHLLQVLKARNIPQAGYPTLRAFLEFSEGFESSPVRNLTRSRRDGDMKSPPSATEVGKPFAPAMFDPVLHSFTPDQPPRGTGRNRQEDAQEFLSFVIDRMHEEILRLQGKDSSGSQSLSSVTSSEDDDWEMVGPKNRSAVTRTHTFSESAITDIFGGQLRSVVKTKGNKASATVQPFLVLHLDIVPEVVHSVEDALRFFAAPESLEGYKPSTAKVGEVVSASKSVKIQTLPRVLILHLMRFSYGSGGSSKLHKPVQFPLELNLGRELLASTSSSGNEIRKYELVATLSHHGKDPSVGHYTADSKQASGQWLHFDDGAVTGVGVTRVLQEQAYVLFYRRARL
ncbi:unnamed protein product [Calypogeia fissa]